MDSEERDSEFRRRFEALVGDLSRMIGADASVVVYVARGPKVAGAVNHGDEASATSRQVVNAIDGSIREAAQGAGVSKIREREIAVNDRGPLLEGRWVVEVLPRLGPGVNVLGLVVELEEVEMELAPHDDGFRAFVSLDEEREFLTVEGLGQTPREAVEETVGAMRRHRGTSPGRLMS